MKSHPANALITETSPYLQQHAHNPVRWYPWGEEALSIAREKDMPILVSIGYSACHWCHVMERESFEDDHVASFMNEHFVNIKIDREERPDLDHFYMDAVQAISGSGGWPLNVFLTPETKPFYGGTYYPPTKAFNRSSWMEVLHSISDVFKNKRDEVEKQAETLVNHLREANGFAGSKRIFEAETESFYSTETCRSIAGTILSAADKKEGGFGKAPKFLQTPLLIYLLQYAHLSGDEASLTHAVFTLKKMLNGGIYDQIGGGISRYSTDNEWLVPHFEKMLYDNALFVIALSEAYQLTGDPQIGNGIRQTLDFVQKELKDKAGGYYTAIDADSEGVEGKFYVWDKQEIEILLGAQSELFCDYFNVTTVGNWEEGNILNITADEETMALKYGLPVDVFKATVNSCKEKLLSARNKRLAPSLDDKILLNCNSLLLSAFCKAFSALGDETYKKAAEELFTFIELNLVDKSGPGSFYHSFKNGQGRYPAFLDDYAYLIEGLILLQEITSNQEYLTKATLLTQYVVKHFTGEGSHFFYYSNSTQMDLIVRKVEVYDGATPSANAVMAKNLLYLGIVFDNLSWRDQASNMLYSLKDALLKYPTSFGVWSGVYLLQSYGINEITITGDNIQPVLDELLGKYIPNKILQSTRSPGFEERPMLKNKLNFTETKIYLCRDYVCQSPCSTVDELIDSIKNLSIK